MVSRKHLVKANTLYFSPAISATIVVVNVVQNKTNLLSELTGRVEPLVVGFHQIQRHSRHSEVCASLVRKSRVCDQTSQLSIYSPHEM